jgi:hypothetical protein
MYQAKTPAKIIAGANHVLGLPSNCSASRKRRTNLPGLVATPRGTSITGIKAINPKKKKIAATAK